MNNNERVVPATADLILHHTAGCCHQANLMAYFQYHCQPIVPCFIRTSVIIVP